MRARISNDRIAHMHGVAEYMYAHAEEYGQNPNTMYLLGLLHDVGYVGRKEKHEQFGADMLSIAFRNMSPRRDITLAIRYHGVTPQWYLANKPYDIPPELVLLWDADMRIESSGILAGEDVGYTARLENVRARYGLHSEPYRICSETIEWLKDHIEEYKKKGIETKDMDLHRSPLMERLKCDPDLRLKDVGTDIDALVDEMKESGFEPHITPIVGSPEEAESEIQYPLGEMLSKEEVDEILGPED